MKFANCFVIKAIVELSILCHVVCRDAPIVSIPNQGEISGHFFNMFRTQKIVGYLGIPYALPPVDDHRFSPPIVDGLQSWQGVRNGSKLMPQCWSDLRRPLKNHDEIFYKILDIDPKAIDSSQFSEDCLYLNIFVPDDPPPKDGYAVIVWLHSGDFMTGNASELNPFQLVFKQKIVMVTIAYRMGIFGFFTSMDGEAPGNFGLMDQSAALLWINRNIQHFNGNAQSITLMGHGSGAVSTSLHLTSGDWSHDLFHRAIIMSGTSLNIVRDPKSYKGALQQLASMFGCLRKTSLLLECLRRVDAAILVENSPVMDWGPVIDNKLSNTTTPFIADDPKILLEQLTSAHTVPIMIGFTDMEDVFDVSMREILDNGITVEMYNTLITDVVLNDLAQLEVNNATACGDGGTSSGNTQPILDALDFVYKPYSSQANDPSKLRRKYIDFFVEKSYIAPSFAMARAISHNAEVFAYRFDNKPKTSEIVNMLPMWSGVPQQFDQIFVWGMPYWILLENQTQWSSEDKRLSDIIMTMWANFAKYANPTEVGVYIRWRNFTESDPGVLIIDRSFNMSDTTSLNYQGVHFWSDYYPKVIDLTTQCCNTTSSASGSYPVIYGSYQLIALLFTNVLLNTRDIRF